MVSSHDPDAAAVFDFLNDYWDDVEQGGARPLRVYLDRYPGHEEAIAGEYLELTRSAQRVDGEIERDSNGGAGRSSERIGPYDVLRELGRGGQGRVVLADDTRIERRVALKVLEGVLISEERRQRFRQEAEIIARLSHPGICAILEADVDGEPPYIAMQFVEGEVLAAALERANRGETKSVFGTVPWAPRSRTALHRVLLFFERAARALHAAHSAGVVHRDIKPGNIAIDRDGAPILLDFGLALDEGSERPGLTRTGEVFGTPAYMPPEQLRGERRAVGARSDVYALGASLYEALVLRRPFEGDNRFQLEHAILSKPLPDPRPLNPVLSEDVKVVLETALEKDQERRYESALAFAEDLRRIREFEPIQARPAGPWLRLRRWARRQPALAAALATTFVLLSGALIHTNSLLRREQRANRFALGRHLAERSGVLLDEDPVCALLVAIESVERAPSYLTRSALYAPLERCGLVDVFEHPNVRRTWDVALSPGSEALAVALDDGHVQLWSTGDGRRGALCEVGTVPVRGVAFHPGGSELAGVDEGGELVRWALDGRELARESIAGAPLLWVEYAPDGTTLVVQPAHAAALLVRLADGRRTELATAPLASGCARFSPDSKRVLTASSDRRGLPLTAAPFARVWDVASGELVHTLEPPDTIDAVLWSEFDPTGTRVALGFSSGSIGLYDVESGERTRPWIELEGRVACATFSPDGRQLVATTDNGTTSEARLFDLSSGSWTSLSGHDGSAIVHAAFDRDGERVATSSYDRTVRVFDTGTGALLRTLRARFRPLCTLWSADGRRLYTRSASARVHVSGSGNQPFAYRLRGHSGAVRWAGFLPDGERAVTASSDGTLRVWSTPRERASAPERGVTQAVLTGHTDAVLGAEVGSVGDRLLSYSEDGSLRIWELEGGNGGASFVFDMDVPAACARFSRDESRALAVDRDGGLHLFQLHGRGVERRLGDADTVYRNARFTPDGGRVAAVSELDRVEFFDVRSGERAETVEFETQGAGVSGALDVAFHPVSSELAIACADELVRFRDLATGEVTRENKKSLWHRELRYSADGRRLLAYGAIGGGSIRIFDFEQERSVQPQMPHKSRINRATFDPTGASILTVSFDGTAYVWDAHDGAAFAHYKLHEGPIFWGAFSPGPEPRRVITASADGTAAIWPVDPYPAALERKPRELYSWEWAFEERLAQPPE